MAKNTGTGTRRGIISNRTQTFNPKTNKFVKRDSETGQFVSNKATPFKGIRKEENAKLTVEQMKNEKNTKQTK